MREEIGSRIYSLKAPLDINATGVPGVNFVETATTPTPFM
jgi:hypothetical protein